MPHNTTQITYLSMREAYTAQILHVDDSAGSRPKMPQPEHNGSAGGDAFSAQAHSHTRTHTRHTQFLQGFMLSAPATS